MTTRKHEITRALREQIRSYARAHDLTENEAMAALVKLGISRAKALDRYARSTKAKTTRRRYRRTPDAKESQRQYMRRRRAGTAR